MLIRKWRSRKAAYWESGAAINTTDIDNWNYRNTNQSIISLLVQLLFVFTYLWEIPNVVPSEHQRPIELVDVTWRISSNMSSRETVEMKGRISCNPGLCSIASSCWWKRDKSTVLHELIAIGKLPKTNSANTALSQIVYHLGLHTSILPSLLVSFYWLVTYRCLLKRLSSKFIHTYVAYLIGIIFSWEIEHLLPNGEGASESSLGLSIYICTYIHDIYLLSCIRSSLYCIFLHRSLQQR